MIPTISPQEFVAKWSKSTLRERAGSQEHFIDLCRLIGHPTPAEADPVGDTFTFEPGVEKQGGKKGWADVWKRGCFGWEYKGKHDNLEKAYEQLLLYRESLLNPPLLIVSDMEQIIVHTNFTNTVKQTLTITLDDLLVPEKLSELRAVFFNPEAFKSAQTPEQVTEAAATEFAHLADLLRGKGAEAHEAAHFLIRLLFCLFAEDISLLPKDLFTELVNSTRKQPGAFADQLRVLFRAMTSGGWFGSNQIRHFNGRLFDDDSVLELGAEGLDILAKVGTLDWSNIEPSILGTLFERSLDPDKRSQLGAHYTSKDDIKLIVEPVLMAPLRRRWETVLANALDIVARRDKAETKRSRSNLDKALSEHLRQFAEEIAHTQVLDPACGSGNFLYIALKELLNLEKEVINFAYTNGLTAFFPSVSPAQLHGIEYNPYARELAQATIWIGYIQWLRENGFGIPSEPILRPLDNIVLTDAIMQFEDGTPVETGWPEVDCIIGNPPFLGGKLLRSYLGDEYVDSLFALYEGRVPREADLVCYWFEKARAMIASGRTKRVGLLATQGIRGGANRRVLKHIKDTGDIFWAQSDRNWVLEGAAVHVSMVGFDDGSESVRMLDDTPVAVINADLTGTIDLTKARRLHKNAELAFMGDTKGGAFDISLSTAEKMLKASPNPNGRPNSEVVKPWINGLDITSRPRQMRIIDFGIDMPMEQASLYEAPFEYVRTYVKPQRESSKTTIKQWWLHERPRLDMRRAIAPLQRYIATPRVSKHRLFAWISAETLADSATIVIARDDDYFFGVLQSKVHELWARRMGTQLREAESGSRYTPTSSFETFPFPWPPGQEPADDPRVAAIGEAARELVEKRDAWLNPQGTPQDQLEKRTLTNLYNARPTWLDLAHRKLDQAVLDAYGWPYDLTDEQILECLLALNLERAAAGA